MDDSSGRNPDDALYPTIHGQVYTVAYGLISRQVSVVQPNIVREVFPKMKTKSTVYAEATTAVINKDLGRTDGEASEMTGLDQAAAAAATGCVSSRTRLAVQTYAASAQCPQPWAT